MLQKTHGGLGICAAHRGQRQAEVSGLVFHLDLNLMEESLDPFLLKAVPAWDENKSLTVEVVMETSLPAHIQCPGPVPLFAPYASRPSQPFWKRWNKDVKTYSVGSRLTL